MTHPISTRTEQLRARLDTEGVLRITLNNPERHNSLTADMLAGLLELFETASGNGDVRAVLVRGEGDRAFASGADIAEQAERASTRTRNPDRGSFMARLQLCTKPVVAMIHGFCLGGGLMVAMAADIRIASAEATFSIPPARLGVAYPLSAIHTLVDLVGRGWATDLCLTGRRIGASEALNIGLVTRVEPKEQLSERTDELLATIVAGAPLTHVASKLSITHAAATLRPPTNDVERAIDAAWASRDAAEGMRAFFDKRDPRFEGR